MASLKISHFSCITRADVELGRMTVLIGPQASGKSLITKLVYFFNEVLIQNFPSFGDNARTVAGLRSRLSEQFADWFPPTAWGSDAFSIEYLAGSYSVSVKRVRGRASPSSRLRVTFSDTFEVDYARANEMLREGLDAFRRANQSNTDHFDVYVAVRERFEEVLKERLGRDLIDTQSFIPAGRSFFTNLSKGMSAFEHSAALDQVTLSFGRRFYSMRSTGAHRSSFTRLKERLNDPLSVELFGGEIVIDKDEYIETNDGRKVPFRFLSSGQQELLPLWLMLLYYDRFENQNTLIFIEEPEAHLFPNAQDTLALSLASRISTKRNSRMIITTHSPYMLSKFNNLLKAEAVATAYPKTGREVSEILPKDAWLKPSETRAYAIIDGDVTSILGDDGLIDAEYLDNISAKIGGEFDRLLNVESEAESQ